MQIKTEIIEDDYEDTEDYFEDEEENDNYYSDEEIEEDVSEHECDFCGKSFKSDLNLKRHVKKVHEKNSESSALTSLKDLLQEVRAVRHPQVQL